MASIQSTGLDMNKLKIDKNSSYRKLNQYQQNGMGYVEYIVVTMLVVIALFTPLPGLGGSAVFDLVLEAIRNFGINSSVLLSLP